MTKTIEELAREYYLNEVINGDTRDNKDGWTDCFVSGADALMQLPLSERLTAEEKERVRKIYAECELIEMDDSPYLPADRITEAGAKMQVLESIFGADFFKEGE